MKISLIGMSGSGKSHWSKKLEKKGFTRFGIDDLLEEQLQYGLKQLGYSGIQDLAKWMRQPYESRYVRTSEIYLQYEKKVMDAVLSRLENFGQDENVVIDTTGSLIYLGTDILEKLTKLTKVIYFQTPQSVQKEMYSLYISDPKPVIWGNSFTKKDNETNIDALKRCYPQLLAFRTQRYEQLADVTFDYFQLRKPDFTLDQFLQKITI